jgi:hypothetical protein
MLWTFDADAYSGSECAEIAEDLAITVKACTAAISLAAARAVGEHAHRERGFADGERWLAQRTGTTRHDARRALQTAGRLGDCLDTRQALLAGEVSLAQAGEIDAPRDCQVSLLLCRLVVGGGRARTGISHQRLGQALSRAAVSSPTRTG